MAKIIISALLLFICSSAQAREVQHYDYVFVAIEDGRGIVEVPFDAETSPIVSKTGPLIFVQSWDDLKCENDAPVIIRLEPKTKVLSVSCEK